MGNQQQPSERRIAKHPVQRMDLFVDTAPIEFDEEVKALRLAEEDWMDTYYQSDPENNLVDTLNTHLSLERLAMKFGLLSELPKLFYKTGDTVGAVDPTIWSSDYTSSNLQERGMLPYVPPYQMPNPKDRREPHKIFPTPTWHEDFFKELSANKAGPILGEEDYLTDLWRKQGYYGSTGPKTKLVMVDRKKANRIVATRSAEYELLLRHPPEEAARKTFTELVGKPPDLTTALKKQVEGIGQGLAEKVEGYQIEDEEGRLILRNNHGEQYWLGPRPYVHPPWKPPKPIYLNPFNSTKTLEVVKLPPLAIGEPHMQPDDNQVQENLQTVIRPEWLEELIYEKTGKDLGVTSCKNCSLVIQYENTDVHQRFMPNAENKTGTRQGYIVCRAREFCASRADLQTRTYQETIDSALEGNPVEPKDISLNDVADASIIDQENRESSERAAKLFASDAATSRRLEAAEMFYRERHIHRRDTVTTLVTNLDDLVERDMKSFKKQTPYNQYRLLWIYATKNGDYVLNPAKEKPLRAFLPPLFLGVLSTRKFENYSEHALVTETNLNTWRRTESREYREKYGWDPDKAVEVFHTRGIPNMLTVDTTEGSLKPSTRVIVTRCVTCGWKIDLYEEAFPDGTWMSREQNYEQSAMFKLKVPLPACYDYQQCALRSKEPGSHGDIERERAKTKLPWFLKWAMAGYPLQGQLLTARDEWILEMNHNCRWDLSTPVVYKKKEFVSRASKLREVLPAGIKPRVTF